MHDVGAALVGRRSFVNVPGRTVVTAFYNNYRKSRSSSRWDV